MFGLRSARRSCSVRITRSPAFVMPGPSMSSIPPMAIEGLDANKDGVYSKEELKPLAQVNVESLKDFDYFTFVHLEGEDDKLLKLKPPVDYWVDYDKSVLTLHFTLP